MKLKHVIGFTCAILIVGSAVSSAPRNDKYPPPRFSSGLTTDAFIDANKIFSYLTNDGGFARDFVAQLNIGGGGGMVYPYAGLNNIANGQANKSCVFAAGLWIGAIDSAVANDTLIVMSEFSSEFTPGTMSGGTFDPDVATFRPYKLYKDSMASNPNQDYLDWPVADGAPVDSAGLPLLTGDQMVWTVFNDADPSKHTNDAGSTAPLGLEVQQSTFAFNREDALGNIFFLRYKIINKGNKTLQNMYISLWSDPDLGGAGDDLVGSDIELSLGYVFNANNSDQIYGSNPPAVGFDFFQGPLDSTGDLSDTAIMWGQKMAGFKNLPLVSFNKYINGTDPNNRTETYGFMTGLDKTGGALIDPTTGSPTNFYGNGDPTTGTGFIDSDPSDRRFMLSTGPITFRPGDSTEIIAAVIVGQAIDRLTSISLMKFYDKFAQSAYELFFNLPVQPDPPVIQVSELSNEVVLSWGPESEMNNGTYPFQGYTVYQGESPTGPWKRLRTTDVNDGNAIVFDDEFDLESGLVVSKPVQLGNDGGINRKMSITQDALKGGRLNNITDYWFRVEAYTLDPTQTPKTLTASTVVGVTPQGTRAGTIVNSSGNDSLAVTHTGPSDGSVTPIVVDPVALTGDSYSVVFVNDSILGIVWNLVNNTTSTTLLAGQTNQSNDELYAVVEGLQVKVSGPPLQGKSFNYASASPLNISPVAIADNGYAGGSRWFTADGQSGGELLFGGIYMEPNFWGATTLGAADYKTVEVRFRPMASYTDLNSDGSYTVGEPYVVDDPAQTQKAFMYQGFSGASFEGFFDVPFTAWDVSIPGSPRQLNVVIRDRDADFAWNLSEETMDAALPNGGDQRFNYTWILNSTYDPSGTMYGDGTGGTIDFWAGAGGAVEDGMWVLWMDERGSSRGQLAEECILTLTPNLVNSPTDVFTFTPNAPTISATLGDADLSRVNVVPNPYYLFAEYESSQFQRQIRFTNLPDKCTVRLFSLSGELVRTFEKDDAVQSWITWDTETDNGLPVASGIYIYIVTTPSGAEKIGKMAIFTEAEQLQNF